MSFIADEAWAKVDPQALKNAGYSGVIGYCSYDHSGKNLAPANVAAYHAAGLQVALVWETYGQAASGGSSVGTKEANDFVAQLRALGATGGTVWMVGEDPNSVGPAGWPNIDAYFAAAAPIIAAAGFRVGDYGSEAYVNHLVGANRGVTRKWFVGGWSQTVNADLIQQSSHPGANTFGGQVDCNYAPAADWGWTEFGGTPPAPPAPPPQPPPRPAHAPDGNPFTLMGEDGAFGNMTIHGLQWKCGTPADGNFGPQSRMALQRHLGVAADGVIGPQTVRAMQARTGAATDGQWGSDTTRHLQHALNAGTF